MKPILTYSVPNTPWHIVITDTSNHFYFNQNDKCSYWQLHDLQEQYGIDIQNFVASVNFDELGVLIAKSRGASIEIKKEEVKEEDSKNEFSEKLVSDAVEEEIVIENTHVSDVIKSPQTPPKQEEKSQSILQGYTSSEDELEGEEQEEQEESTTEVAMDMNQIASQAIAQYQPSQNSQPPSEEEEEEEEDDNNDDNNSLDLSLDDEDDNDDDTNQSSIRQDFMDLLDQFSGNFSIYQSWDLIEEELIGEFAKLPEFLAVPSKQEREKLFQKWCLKQEEKENLTAAAEEYMNIFPTPKLQYLKFLQEFKLEIKDSFYQTFYNTHHLKINEFDLSPSIKETIFRSFKIMLNDFTKFAKNFKKMNKNSNQNIKVMKLNEFLRGQNLQGSYTIDEKLSHFDNWIKLLNKNDISALVAENEINFLVGDEKRLHSYIDQLTN